MSRRWIAGLLASFGVTAAACSGAIADTPVDPTVADASPPPVVVDASTRPDATPEPKACAAPLVDPKCATTQAAPTGKAAIEAFVKEGAVPLRCEQVGQKPAWDLGALVDLFGTQKIFMMGEVHGSNEIGIVSSLVLELLASKKLVNVVGYELPMDYEEVLQKYVTTGRDQTAEQVMGSLAPNMFGAILTQTARDATAKGHPMKVAAVDVPTSPDYAVAALEALATKLTTKRPIVLDTLPTNARQPPTPEDITKVNAYFDLVIGRKAEVCTELSAAECERLVAMVHALWASTLASDRNEGQSGLWFSRREEVIYSNMKAKMATPQDRMYLHMGAFHTNKHEDSAGSRMAKEYELTKGQVFSVAPAYDDGSIIFYGRDQRLPGEPRSISGALGTSEMHPAFVSNTRPSSACLKNPIGLEPEDTVTGSGTRGQLYDGYIHYGKLTSEQEPDLATLPREGALVGRGSFAAFAAFRANVARREAEAFRLGLRKQVAPHR